MEDFWPALALDAYCSVHLQPESAIGSWKLRTRLILRVFDSSLSWNDRLTDAHNSHRSDWNLRWRIARGVQSYRSGSFLFFFFLIMEVDACWMVVYICVWLAIAPPNSELKRAVKLAGVECCRRPAIGSWNNSKVALKQPVNCRLVRHLPGFNWESIKRQCKRLTLV